MKHTRVGFIGLGIMGQPMAAHLVRAGFEVHVYNRTTSKTEALVKLGATAHLTCRELAACCDAVVCMVHDAPDVAEVLAGPEGAFAGMAPGGLVVNMSTVSPASDKDMAARATARGLEYLDAPVSGGDVGAKKATLSIMVGGPAEVFEKALPILQTMGKTITHCGPHGHGQATKLCNQIMVAINLTGVCEALKFAQIEGLDPGPMLTAVSSGAAASWQLQNLAPRIVAADHEPGFRLRALCKDLAAIQKELSVTEGSLAMTALATQKYNQAMQAGLGERGTQAVTDVL